MRRVVKLSLSGDYLNSYSTIKDAGLTVGIAPNNICTSCRSKGKNTAGGFRWAYECEYSPKPVFKKQHKDNTALETKVYGELEYWSFIMPKPAKVDWTPDSVDYIASEVCNYFNMTKEEVFQKSRKQELVFARYLTASVSVYYLKKYRVGGGLKNIGEFIGIDHATVLNGAKTITKNIETGYRIDEIEEVANLFHLTSQDLIYKPNSPAYC